MSDLVEKILSKVGSDLDPFKKILSHIPGFKGYINRQSRRDADKLLRETVAKKIEEQWQRISELQRDFINQGEIDYVDDLESAAIKLRTFADRIRRAPRGYSGLFDAVQINEDELNKMYQYDAAMLELASQVEAAIDNVEASVGTDGLPASIRNLKKIAQNCILVYDKRCEVVFSSDEGK
jgi:hypothetical protein